MTLTPEREEEVRKAYNGDRSESNGHSPKVWKEIIEAGESSIDLDAIAWRLGFITAKGWDKPCKLGHVGVSGPHHTAEWMANDGPGLRLKAGTRRGCEET